MATEPCVSNLSLKSANRSYSHWNHRDVTICATADCIRHRKYAELVRVPCDGLDPFQREVAEVVPLAAISAKCTHGIAIPAGTTMLL